MANQTTEKMVLGSLMQNPTLLVNIEKYNLVNQDFNDKLNQYIFYAISSAAFEGAKSVTVQDIELQLQGTKGETLFTMHNGIDLLNDYIELSNLDNFDSYYKLLKKENLLRDLSDYGFDVSRFYKENPFTQEDYEINETYLDMDNSEIINIIRRSLLDIEEEYATSHYSKTTSISDNIYEFLEDLENAPRVGLPLQGEIFNSMINGAQRGTYMVRSAASGTGKTRSAVADACQLAYPIRYDWRRAQWIASGHNEKVMLIITEQQDSEIKPMVLAYLSGINQNSIEKMSTLTKAQREVLLQAAAVMETFSDNFLVVRFPEPTIQGIKNIIRNSVLKYDISYVFYDYIFINPALLSEFKHTRLRNDEVLLMFSTALKDLAVELDIFVATSTQTSAAGDNNTNIRNESAIAGSRAIVNKADIGCILSRPTPEELKALKTVLDSISLQPNIVTDLYKNRNGQYTNVRIWSYFDMGTLQREDLFVTDARLSAIEYSSDNILFEFPVKPEIYKKLLVELNGK